MLSNNDPFRKSQSPPNTRLVGLTSQSTLSTSVRESIVNCTIVRGVDYLTNLGMYLMYIS